MGAVWTPVHHVDYLQCDAVSNNPTYKLHISDLTFFFFHKNTHLIVLDDL